MDREYQAAGLKNGDCVIIDCALCRIAELEKEQQRLTMQLAETKDLLSDRTAENALFRAENERLREQLSEHITTDNTGVIAEQDAEILRLATIVMELTDGQ